MTATSADVSESKRQTTNVAPFGDRRVELPAGETEPEIRRRHVGERALPKPKPAPRRDLDLARRHAPEARLDDLDRVGGSQERGDVGLAEVERHGAQV